MIWIATMELKWIKEEIVIEKKMYGGGMWAEMTGKYEKILHQKFKNNEGDSEWRVVPTD